MDSHDKVTETVRIARLGVVVNLLLSGVKLAVGYVGHSQTVIADAIHSLSDLGTDFILLIGVRYWHQPPDDHHPYGHRRIETLISVAIGFCLFFVGVGLVVKAVDSLLHGRGRDVGLVAAVGPALSIVVKGILYRVTLGVGERLRSQAVIANAFHHRSDILSSLPALASVGIAALRPKWGFLDGVGSILVSCFIFTDAWKIIGPSLAELMDCTDVEKNDQIRAKIAGMSGVGAIHSLRTRRHGDSVLMDVDIMVDPEISVREGHEIAERVKESLMAQDRDIVDVVVHVEPLEAGRRCKDDGE